MKRNICSIFFILLLSLSFYSCEWDSDEENYVEIERPQEDVIVGIDLAGVKENEVIYVYNHTYLYYSLSTQGKTVLETNFYLDGRRVEQYSDALYLNIDWIDDKEHDLKVDILLKSGSGSIADFANLEHYIGEYNFKVRFIDYSDTQRLKVRQTLDENNYLKLIWDKPSLPVDKYEIYHYSWYGYNQLIATVNSDQNWYVDTDYIYGLKQFRIVAYISNSNNVSFEGHYTVEYIPLSEDNFTVEIVGLDEVKFAFTNPNPYPFSLIVDDNLGNTYRIKDEDNILIKKSMFPVNGETAKFWLVPANYEGNDYYNYDYFYCYYSDDYLQITPYATTFDVVRKQLIGSQYYTFLAYDKDLNLISNISLDYYSTSAGRINSLCNGFLAIQDDYDFLHIYSDNVLNKEIWILPLQYTDRFTTGKNIIAVTDPIYDTLSLYDSRTTEKLLVKDYGGGEDYSRWLSAHLSYDDKYIAVLNYNLYTKIGWYKLYEISGNILIEKKTETNVSVNNIIFNSNNPDEMFICYNNSFDVVDLTTMQTKKSIVGTFINIDVVTGNLLYKVNRSSGYVSNEYKILDSSYTNELFTFHTDNYDDAKLFNNYFMQGSYYIHTDKIKSK